MIYYKSIEKRLVSCGWELVRQNSINPFTGVGTALWRHPGFSEDFQKQYEIEAVFAANKNGTPGKILQLFQGGRVCQC